MRQRLVRPRVDNALRERLHLRAQNSDVIFAQQATCLATAHRRARRAMLGSLRPPMRQPASHASRAPSQTELVRFARRARLAPGSPLKARAHAPSVFRAITSPEMAAQRIARRAQRVRALRTQGRRLATRARLAPTRQRLRSAASTASPEPTRLSTCPPPACRALPATPRHLLPRPRALPVLQALTREGRAAP